jgi:hypothetical protein
VLVADAPTAPVRPAAALSRSGGARSTRDRNLHDGSETGSFASARHSSSQALASIDRRSSVRIPRRTRGDDRPQPAAFRRVARATRDRWDIARDVARAVQPPPARGGGPAVGCARSPWTRSKTTIQPPRASRVARISPRVDPAPSRTPRRRPLSSPSTRPPSQADRTSRTAG